MSTAEIIAPSRPRVARASKNADWLLPVVPMLFLLSIMVIPLKFQVGGFVFSLTRLLIIVIIFPLLFKLLAGHAGRLRIFDLGVFFYALWAIVTIIYWHGNGAVPFVGSNTLELLGGYLIGRVCVRNTAQLSAVYGFFVLLVLLTLPFAVFESVTGRYLAIEIINKVPLFFGPTEWVSPPRMGLDRAQVLIENAIHYGVISAAAMSLAVVGQTGHWSGQRRFWTGTGVFLCAFLALSSGAFLAVLMQLGLIIWAAMFRANENRWIILGVLSLIAYSIIEMLSDRDAITVFLSYATFSPQSAMHRLRIFEYGMNNVWANPFMGIGLNDWERPSWMVVRSVDNFWLLTAMRHGFPGFTFLFIGWFSLIFAVLLQKAPIGTRYFWIRRGWLFMIIGLSMSLTTVHIWGSVYSFVFFLLGTGAALLNDADREADRSVAVAPGAVRAPARKSGHMIPAPGRDMAPANRYTRFPAGRPRSGPNRITNR